MVIAFKHLSFALDVPFVCIHPMSRACHYFRFGRLVRSINVSYWFYPAAARYSSDFDLDKAIGYARLNPNIYEHSASLRELTNLRYETVKLLLTHFHPFRVSC